MNIPTDGETPASPGAPDASSQARADRDERLVDLMSRVARADRQAFQDLYRHTSPILFGVVLRINRDRGCAEEILQEVFISVWRRAGTFDRSQGKVLTWLTTIARHRAIDSIRQKQSEPVTISRFGGLQQESGDEHETDLLEGMSSGQPTPLELLDDATRANDLQRCMSQLSGEQRSSLALAYYQGLSHAELADHMNQPLGTVKSWVRRGLLSLRACLDRAARQMAAVGRVG